MNITNNLKYFFILPVVVSLLSLAALAMWGLKPGIDLKGGSLLAVSYPPTGQAGTDGLPTAEQIHAVVDGLGFGEVRVQPTGENGYILRQRDLSETEHQALLSALGKEGTVHEEEYTSIGPSIGTELMQKAWIAITLVVVLIILFIAFAFRKASSPSSWKYGVVAIITLVHDILVPTGLFALLGHFTGAEVDALFVVGLLTILGISINDTIVVFDRIRENLRLNSDSHRREEFGDVVGRSIMQTLARSINTSLTVIIVLAALYFMGPVSTQAFALTLIVGMVAGTYSSIFLAAPLLVVWERRSKKN